MSQEWTETQDDRHAEMTTQGWLDCRHAGRCYAAMYGAVPEKPLKSAKLRKSENFDMPENSENLGPSCWVVMQSS